LLATHMKDIVFGNVADLGAGWGYLTVQCLKLSDRIKAIDLFEADYEALDAAYGNLERLGATVPLTFNWHDVTSEKIPGIYDTIIMNPPFHEGRVRDVSLGQSFIAAAASRLKSGGRLLMVANRQLPDEATLKGLFKQVNPLDEAHGFKDVDAKEEIKAALRGRLLLFIVRVARPNFSTRPMSALRRYYSPNQQNGFHPSHRWKGPIKDRGPI